MMIYLWKIINDYPENLIGEYDRDQYPDRFIFKKGEKILIHFDAPIFNFKASPHDLLGFDDLANNALIPLISNKIASILNDICPNDIQLIDAIVLANGIEIRDYKILNIVNSVQGIDHNASEYLTVPGTKQIMKFKKLRYFENCLGDFLIARDAEYLSNLLVSKTLRDELLLKGVKNLGLYLPEEII